MATQLGEYVVFQLTLNSIMIFDINYDKNDRNLYRVFANSFNQLKFEDSTQVVRQ